MGGGAVFRRAAWLAPWLGSAARLLHVRRPRLPSLVAVAACVYFALAFATGGADIGMIRRNIKRTRGSGPERRRTDSGDE